VNLRGALLLAVLLVPGQQPQPTFKSRIDLVQVDVVVVDKGGNQVRGLKAEDFVLSDRGRPQAIATFEEITHRRDTVADLFPVALKRDVASNQGPQADRLVVLVLDDLHIYKGRTARAQQIARDTIHDLGAQGSMAVLFTSGANSTQVTEDRSRVLAAVETLRGRRALRRPSQAIDSQSAGRIDPEADFSTNLAAVQKGQDTTLQDFWDNMAQFKTLEGAARLLAAGSDSTRKAFILISEGVAREMTGVFEAGESPSAAVRAIGGSSNGYHEAALRAMMKSMWRNNVSAYAIDPRGHITTRNLAEELSGAPGWDNGSLKNTDSDAFRWTNPVRLAQRGLGIMAEAAGGFGITDTNDFASGVKRIVEDLDHYYLLGFYPAETTGTALRPVQVSVPGHPEWTLRFRKGYVPGTVSPLPANKSQLVALSAGVLPARDLPLRLSAMPFPGSGEASRVVMSLEVTAPVKSLLEADGKLRDVLTYQVLVVDEKKSKAKSMAGLKGRLALSPREASTLAPETVRYQVGESIELPPGLYQLRVSATSDKLAAGGSVYLNLEVPKRKDTLSVSGLAIGYTDDARVLVAPPATGTNLRRGIQPARALPLVPTVSREFVRSDTLRLYFEIAAPHGAPPRTLIEVLNSENHAVHSASPMLAADERWRVDTPLPLADFAPGPYIIRVTAIGASGTIRREAGIVVR
jgi:VWFA-related protein